jgi:tetratricopeptide (TPR) repeat protein
MSADSSLPAKKQRVLSWKPEEQPDAGGQARKLPRWVTVLAGVGVALLLVVVFVGGLVVYRLDKMRREAALVAQAEVVPGDNLRSAFVSRSRAEFAREAAMSGIQNVRKVPTDHPAVLRRLIAIERVMLTADKAFGDANYGIAVQQYETVAADTKQFAAALEDMRKAREGYDRFLVDFARMERLRPLAPEKFDAALTSAGAAQTFLTEGSFSVAREKIEEAARTLASVETSVAAELEKALSAGRAALAQGDGQAATAAFQRALELQTDNEVALQGLERAGTIEQVFAFLREADTLEKAARFEDAQAIFEKAFKLDGKSATAQAGIARMKTSIRERDFKAALDRAVAAREDARWNDAIVAYEEAIKLHPDDKDLKEQLATVRVEQREAYIQDSLAAAYDFERQYDWNNARRVYLDLLKFEPEQTDAVEGLGRTGKVLRALLKFERLVDDARSQAQRANFQAAIGAFNEALANKPSYLALTPEQDELRVMLERQSRPVQVAFVSDNKTYVTIQGLRLLGRFDQTSIALLPGNYEVIGRRRGYQDVREFVRVRGDDPMQPITIIANTRM